MSLIRTGISILNSSMDELDAGRTTQLLAGIPTFIRSTHAIGIIVRKIRGDLQEQRHATAQHRHQHEPGRRYLARTD